MSRSQVQIIRSLGEALAWFEKELVWNVEPAELRHLTGRIGELYAAMITRGQMALGVNQPGYDVVSAEGEHISVKTITTSTHVTFKKATFDAVHRVMVLRIHVDENEASIEEVFDGPAASLKAACKETNGDYVFATKKPVKEGPPSDLKVTASVQSGERTVTQFENGSASSIPGTAGNPSRSGSFGRSPGHMASA